MLDRKASLKRNNTRFRLRPISPTGRPGQTPLLTLTRSSDRECIEPLLIAPLRLAQLEPTRTIMGDGDPDLPSGDGNYRCGGE